MADNLKVNAKSKILTFKKKHNLLVGDFESIKEKVLNDKEILKNIIYDVEHTKIIFPKNVLPLAFKDQDDNIYYFNYDDGTLQPDSNTSYDGISVQGNQIIVDDFDQICIWDDEVQSEIAYIEFIYFEGNQNLTLNAYYLYNPIKEGGTKLYKHELTLGNNIMHFIIISTKSTSYKYNDFLDFGIVVPDNALVIGHETYNDYWFFNPYNVFYDTTFNNMNAIFYDGTPQMIATVSIQPNFTVTDVVTEY